MCFSVRSSGVISFCLFCPSDSFRDDGLEDAHAVKGVAHSMPLSVPVFRRSPKKNSTDNDDERVS